MLTLDGRTAIVTGGASGIGAAVCTALQKEGVRVASLDLQTGGPAELGYECDVSDETSVANAVANAAKDLGDVHYAFVNAGIAGMGSVLTMPMEEWDRVTRVNFRGAFMTLQHTARAIKASGNGGAIVATASSAAVVADMGFVHYSMAKIGVTHMVRVAARELGPFGIRVNAIAPGPTRTPMMAGTDDIPGFVEAVEASTPLGGLGDAEDIAETVLALFALRWVTGQTVAADGGITLVAGTDMPGLTAETLAQW
jgi:NAD(P)-dependent dehydrogenase (short-subunit alcohol dehydrogenase family)